MMKGIFDSHSHYTDKAFDTDRYELLASLPERGVEAVMLACTDVNDSISALKIANDFDFVYSSAGIHPECAGNISGNYLAELEKIAKSSSKIKAIGEIGIDYHYEGYDEKLQKRLFEEQLELAKSLGLPVIIHSRDATADTLEIIKKHRPVGVVHCFSGSKETALELADMGMYIGLTGVVTFKNAKKACSVAQSVPIDRLLIETDCPYMAPEPWRSKRCDSSMLVSVTAKIAELRGITAEDVAKNTCENARRLFRIND